MSYTVNSLEEMPNALSYLIKTVEELQSTVKALQHKQASDSPKWMDIDELCAYLPSHPAKQTVYGWVSAKQIPVHKIEEQSPQDTGRPYVGSRTICQIQKDYQIIWKRWIIVFHFFASPFRTLNR